MKGKKQQVKKRKKKQRQKKKKKKSREKLNVNDVINGELKVQVNNIENVMIPKTISIPCSFSLSCSIEGIDKILKSREVITDDLRNVVFNWATRVLLKKKTLKDLSCKCNINLSVEQKNKNISLGNCEFEWRKCLLKSNWDKFAINETFQVLTDRKYKKIPMGNIKILAKFIPFGSKDSNYSKFGKKDFKFGAFKWLIFYIYGYIICLDLSRSTPQKLFKIYFLIYLQNAFINLIKNIQI